MAGEKANGAAEPLERPMARPLFMQIEGLIVERQFFAGVDKRGKSEKFVIRNSQVRGLVIVIRGNHT